jgi:hypothetical protein
MRRKRQLIKIEGDPTPLLNVVKEEDDLLKRRDRGPKDWRRPKALALSLLRDYPVVRGNRSPERWLSGR